MSLKAFHIFFIVISAVLCLGIGVARAQAFMAAGGASTLIQALAGFVAGAALLVYLRSFFRKTKDIGYLTFFFLILGPSCAQACSVCFGDPESPQGQAMKAGIFVMLGFVGTVLAGFGGLFLYWMTRSRRLALEEEKGVSLS